MLKADPVTVLCTVCPRRPKPTESHVGGWVYVPVQGWRRYLHDGAGWYLLGHHSSGEGWDPVQSPVALDHLEME